jgi:hypothetical protein
MLSSLSLGRDDAHVLCRRLQHLELERERWGREERRRKRLPIRGSSRKTEN